MSAPSPENNGVEVGIPSLWECRFVPVFNWQPIKDKKTDCVSKHTLKSFPTSALNARPVPELCFHSSEEFPEAVSRGCQTPAFDSRFNAWEYLQHVDLCLSGERHFITSFSPHIHPGLLRSPRQHKSGPGPESRPTERCYKTKSHRLAAASAFTFGELFVLYVRPPPLRLASHIPHPGP